MDEQEANNKRIQTGTNLEQTVYAAVEKLRINEDRPMSQMINVLLKTHPRVQEVLEAEPVGVSA